MSNEIGEKETTRCTNREGQDVGLLWQTVEVCRCPVWGLVSHDRNKKIEFWSIFS